LPDPIGPLHKFLTAGTSHGASGDAAAPAATTSAPANPSVVEPGAPAPSPLSLVSSAYPPAPALYISPALRALGISTDLPAMPCAAPASPRHVWPLALLACLCCNTSGFWLAIVHFHGFK
jgi:hypothetical protein